MAKIKIWLVAILVFFTGLYLHNAWLYSLLGGYDAGIQTAYTKILIFEKRIPTPVDTLESYNPPTFYFITGKIAQFFTPLFKGDFLEALKVWQIIIALLLPLAGYFWLDIFRTLIPKNKLLSLLFLIWLLSVPVINKLAPMYSMEPVMLIFGSFIIWYFIKFILVKPNLSKIVLLGIFGGFILSFRLMSFSLLLALGLMMILLAYFKKISFKKMLICNLIFTVITLTIGGQYYYFYRDKGVFDSGENMAEIRKTPFFKRQPKSFYLDTFFRTSMKQPVRPNFFNRFIPIFYSDFWGDYWNYFPQRRFGLSIMDVRKNRLNFTQAKINRLAWQNRINLIPSVIIVLGIITVIISLVKDIIKRKPLTYQQLSEHFLAIFFITAFLAFFYTNIQFPNLHKGDTIKASYMLYAIPALIYFAVKFLKILQKYSLLFYSLILIIIISIGFNLNFNFF